MPTTDNLTTPPHSRVTSASRRVSVILGVLVLLSALVAAPAVAGPPALTGQPADVDDPGATSSTPVAETVIAAETSDRPDYAAAATFTCMGLKATIVGTNGKDNLNGTAKRDVIVARGGNDVINGRGGDDVICAGSGSDTVQGGTGNDTINLGAGNDTGRGGPGRDTVVGGSGNDKLFGDAGNDTLRGDAGNDTIEGGIGNDTIEGGADNDTLYGNAGKDSIWGGPGNDTIEGGNGNDALRGEGGADIVKGGRGVDKLYGGAGADYLIGGPGSDSANGGGGVDACDTESRVSCEPTSLVTGFDYVAREWCGSYWRFGPLTMDGRTHSDSLYCPSYDVGEQGWIEYDLGRKYTRFKAVLGIWDDSESSTDVYRFRVYGDGALLASHDVEYGQRKPISVPMNNVLRLRLEVTMIGGGNDASISGWGSAMVTANAAVSFPAAAKVKPLPRARLDSDIVSVDHQWCGSYWRVGPATINGRVYSDSVMCPMYDTGDLGYQDFVLSRAYRSFATTVGQRDDSERTDGVTRFRIYADESLVRTIDVGFGSAVPVTLDVTGVLRLRLEAERVSGLDGSSWAVYGEPVVRP